MYVCICWACTSVYMAAGVNFFNLFIFNERGTDCSFHNVLKRQEWENVDDTKATISRSTQWGWALCRLLQPPVAKLHQSCWAVSNNPWRWVFPLLGWNKYQIRHHTSAPFCLLSLPVFPPLLCVPASFSLLFIPLQLCTPRVALDGAVAGRPHPVKRHWNVGRRKVRREPGSPVQLPEVTP